MFKVTSYREHAGECRRLARQSTFPHIRDELLKMADAWDQLAEQREQELAKQRIATATGGSESAAADSLQSN